MVIQVYTRILICFVHGKSVNKNKEKHYSNPVNEFETYSRATISNILATYIP